jgi:broad specificity phosphatase PhoE
VSTSDTHAVEADPSSGSASTRATSPSEAASAAGGVSASAPGVPAIILIRHGETEWSKSGQHTGRTDVPLTETGQAQARAAGPIVRRLLGGHPPSLVVSSPRRRAQDTAALAGFAVQRVDPDAAEWDYGDYEGLTSSQIHQRSPGWTIWTGHVPGGESAAEVTARFDRLLDSVRGYQASGPVLIFSHGHASRGVTARWLGEPVAQGQHLYLSTGAVSALGHEHAVPTILRWNIDSSVSPAADADR